MAITFVCLYGKIQQTEILTDHNIKMYTGGTNTTTVHRDHFFFSRVRRENKIKRGRRRYTRTKYIIITTNDNTSNGKTMRAATCSNRNIHVCYIRMAYIVPTDDFVVIILLLFYNIRDIFDNRGIYF